MEWLNTSITPLKDLLAFLYKKSKTSDVHKKQLIIELRDNLNVFKNGFFNQSPYDTMIDLLSRDAIQSAIKENFSFKKLRSHDAHDSENHSALDRQRRIGVSIFRGKPSADGEAQFAQ